MESDSKEDTSTKHVLDYYKKYSQNKELPKYFSGTSLSYLPEIKDADSPDVEVKTLMGTDIKIHITSDAVNDAIENIGNLVGTSGTSSPMSNHKLEWDNGADIGYSNCEEKRLRKSSSLPIITDSVDSIQRQADSGTGPVTSKTTAIRSQSSSSDSNVKVLILPYSSSSEYHSDENNASLFEKKNVSSSSSSNVNVAALTNTRIAASSSDSSSRESLRQFASTLSYLKRKIGLPDAQSTPKFLNAVSEKTHKCSNMPVLNTINKACTTSKSLEKLQESSRNISRRPTKKSVHTLPAEKSEQDMLRKQIDFTRGDPKDTSGKCLTQKIVNLAVTKPITVECACSKPSVINKSLQTVKKQSSVAVQTDNVAERVIPNYRKPSNNQSLIYFEYSDSNKTSGSSTQTGSNAVESNCDSFEFLKRNPSPVQDSVPQNSDGDAELPFTTDLVTQEQKHTNTLKNSQKTSDCTCPSEDISTKSSTNTSLEHFVSSGILNNVEDDIGKNIHLLQRLLKSKKYDKVTKKRYIKKLINKITESKFLEDSSTSSELFIPKKIQKIDFSGDKNDNILEPRSFHNPEVDVQFKLSPRRKNLVQKTFTQDFLPSSREEEEVSSVPEIIPIRSRDVRKNPFTLTGNECSVNHKNERGKSTNISSETDSTSLEKHYKSSSASTKSYENWREDKTLSEKILEEQSVDKPNKLDGNGDYFVKFANKEREFQLTWINNEISHLGKLKSLLEKPVNVQKEPLSTKKTTNVYTVFNENESKAKPKRNYVIETFIGAQSSSDMNFKLNGQVYTIQGSSNSKSNKPKKSKRVTGNIEVISSDSTTNIKVTTFCGKCKTSPCKCQQNCLCYHSNESCICQPDSRAEIRSPPCTNYICHVCKKIPCICDDIYRKYKKTVRIHSKEDILGTSIPVPSGKAVKFSPPPGRNTEKITGNFQPLNQKVNSTTPITGNPIYLGRTCSCEIQKNCGSDTCICQVESLFKAVHACTGSSSKSCDGACYICKTFPCMCSNATYSFTRNVVNVPPYSHPFEEENQNNLLHLRKNRDVTHKTNVFVGTYSTSSSSKTYLDCLCCKDPTETTKSKDDLTGTFIPCASSKRKPMVSHKGNEKRDYASSSPRIDVVDRATTIAESDKGLVGKYGTLRKVFENCVCTQTSCTCDFVEKLFECFSKPGVQCSTICDNKCLDSEKFHTVGLQTAVDTQSRKQQTVLPAQDEKSLQTEKVTGNIRNIDIQTHLDTKTESLQVPEHFLTSEVREDIKNTEVQVKVKVKDQDSQVAPIDAGKHDKTTTPIEKFLDRMEQQQDVATSVDNLNKQQDVSTTAKVVLEDKSVDNFSEQTTVTTSPVVQTGTTYSKIFTLQQDAATSPAHIPMENVAGSTSDIRKQQDASTSPSLTALSISDVIKKKKNQIHRATGNVDRLPTEVDYEEERSEPLKPKKESSKEQKLKAPSVQFIDKFPDQIDKQVVALYPPSERLGQSSVEEEGERRAFHPTHTKRDSTTSPREQSVASMTTPSLHDREMSPVEDPKQSEGPASKQVKLRTKSVETDKPQDTTGSQTVAGNQSVTHSDTTQPTSSKSSSSEGRKKKVICVCCCTQTEMREKHRGRNVKVQAERSEKPDKSGKTKRDSTTTSSTTYEICPSILVSSGNDTSLSVGEDLSSRSSVTLCFCCKEKYPWDKIYILGSKNENYPLCCNCLAQRPVLTAMCYAGPEDSCPCAKPSSYQATKTDASDETKKTITTVTDSYTPEEYCTCTKPASHAKRLNYCAHCQYMLRNTARSKNGIAYTLTLEAGSPSKPKRKKKRNYLQEIRVKVPSPSSKKKHKDKENFSKRDGDKGKEKKCTCGTVICTRNCHVHGMAAKRGKDKKKTGLTLQEHLKKNRPHFIESAETRRHAVLNSKNEREEGLDDAKLKFLDENVVPDPPKPKKLFTAQEMKEITRRNYKKLPEVQEKINTKREQRLRSADRFIADVLTRKIQHSVLKGKKNFPIDTNIISLPKT